MKNKQFLNGSNSDQHLLARFVFGSITKGNKLDLPSFESLPLYDLKETLWAKMLSDADGNMHNLQFLALLGCRSLVFLLEPLPSSDEIGKDRRAGLSPALRIGGLKPIQ